MADARGLGPREETLAGSSPVAPTTTEYQWFKRGDRFRLQQKLQQIHHRPAVSNLIRLNTRLGAERSGSVPRMKMKGTVDSRALLSAKSKEAAPWDQAVRKRCSGSRDISVRSYNVG
jgi:hypothetical protein